MHPDFFPQHWLTNTLLDDGFIVQKAAELAHLLRSFKVMAGKRPEYLTLLQ